MFAILLTYEQYFGLMSASPPSSTVPTGRIGKGTGRNRIVVGILAQLVQLRAGKINELPALKGRVVEGGAGKV